MPSARRKTASIAAVAVVSAFLGAVAVLAVGRATGWLDDGETVVLSPSPAAPPEASALIESPAAAPSAATGFDPGAIYRRRSAGVVTIYALFDEHAAGDVNAQAQGSGFVVSPEGYILTNSHVITTAGEETSSADAGAASEVYVEFRDGDRVSASVVGWDIFDDVGVLKVDPERHALAPLPLGDSSKVAVGEPVAAIGSPFGQASSLTVGVVSATERSVESLTSRYNLVDAIQTDAPINRGNSGGPLFNARGDVIGINAQIRSASGNAEGVGFAIPINAARRSMEQLIATGRVRYAWVGVSTQTVTPALARFAGIGAERGALIEEVMPDSPAEEAGLRAGREQRRFEGRDFAAGGDVIIAIDGQRVETAEDLIRIVSARLFPGQRARFEVVRGSGRLTVSVVLGERPASPADVR